MATLHTVLRPCRCVAAAILLLIALPVGAAPAAEKPGNETRRGPVFHPLPGGVQMLRLENGLQVLLMPNPAQPMVGIYTQVKVGSAREDYRTSGMSHMLEHLLFNGTEKYTQEELYDLADNAGAYNNANTSDFFTNYMLVVPTAGIETGLEIQSQMLFSSLIPADKFAKEQGIVLGELVQARDWPGHFAEVALRQALFEGSCLELPTLGTRSTIEHMARDDVHAFYKQWYVPNNMVLTLAGNFDPRLATELLEKYYGTHAPGTLAGVALAPAAGLDRSSAAVRRGGDRRVAALAFAAPTYGDADFFPFLVMTELLTLPGTGILTRALEGVDEQVRPELSLWWEKAPGCGRLVLEFDLPAQADAQALPGLVQAAAVAAVKSGIAAEDILGIVRTSETRTLLEREQLRMTGISIAEDLVLGGVDFLLSYLPRLGEVKPADVSRALSEWIVEAPCRAVLVEPDPRPAADSPPAGMPAGMAGGMPGGMTGAPKSMPPGMPGKPGGMPGAGGAANPVAAAPVESPPAAALPVDRSVLANGAVLISQTNPDNPLQAVHLAVRGRARLDRQEAQAGGLDMVHRLLTEGVAGCDRTCLARRLQALGAQVKLVDDPGVPMDNYYTNGRFSFIRVESAAARGDAVLDLLADLVRRAEFTREDFERIRSQRVGDLARAQGSARTTADGLLGAALYPGHPLVLPAEGNVESLTELDFTQVRRLYESAFSPQNLVIAVVGPTPHERLKTRLEELLPGRGEPSAGLPPLTATAAAQTVTASVGGELAAIRLGSVLAVAPGDFPALSLAVSVLSDRMAMDLREARGLSYSVGAGLDGVGKHAVFTAWINPPRERKDEGLAAIAEFVRSFDAATVTQPEMDKIRNASRGRTLMRRLSSMGQAYYLCMAELEGDWLGYNEAGDRLDRVTLADLRTAAARYLQTMPLVTVVVD